MHHLTKSALMLCLVFSSAYASHTLAGQGYVLQLKLSANDARHDPDKVWSDDDLAFISQQGFVPKIYTAWATTPAGEWLLSQTNGDCNMQGMCTAILYLRKKGAVPREMASVQLREGGKAVLSLNYRKLMTDEIDENGKPFTGNYDVAPTP